MEAEDTPVLVAADGKDGELGAGGSEQANGGGHTAADEETLNPVAKAGSDGKSSKSRKDLPGAGRGTASAQRTGRRNLSQSVSFPTKSLRKSSTFMKVEMRNPRTSGADTSSTSLSAPLPKSTVAMAIANGGPSAKSDSVEATVDGDPPAQKDNGSVKAYDDSQSNIGLRKSGNSGFAFRLDERAEKRKEFFMKLEEKIQAKEVEKSNLQAKSKESQKAEIKQLRKSLTFRATPMPSFYQEPGLPKVELKKIPPTRAISPKLGRHEPSAAVVDNSSRGGVSCKSSHVSLDQSKVNGGAVNGAEGSLAAKKPLPKALAKQPSRRSLPATKPLGPKPKVVNPKQYPQKTIESVHDQKDESHPEIVDNVVSDRSEATIEIIETHSKLPETTVSYNEVPVLG